MFLTKKKPRKCLKFGWGDSRPEYDSMKPNTSFKRNVILCLSFDWRFCHTRIVLCFAFAFVNQMPYANGNALSQLWVVKANYFKGLQLHVPSKTDSIFQDEENINRESLFKPSSNRKPAASRLKLSLVSHNGVFFSTKLVNFHCILKRLVSRNLIGLMFSRKFE